MEGLRSSELKRLSFMLKGAQGRCFGCVIRVDLEREDAFGHTQNKLQGLKTVMAAATRSVRA